MIPPFQAAAMSRVQSFPLEDSVIARRAQEIEPFVVMEVMERAQALEAEGEHLIHMEVGEPDFPTPVCIQEAATKALGTR